MAFFCVFEVSNHIKSIVWLYCNYSTTVIFMQVLATCMYKPVSLTYCNFTVSYVCMYIEAIYMHNYMIWLQEHGVVATSRSVKPLISPLPVAATQNTYRCMCSKGSSN